MVMVHSSVIGMKKLQIKSSIGIFDVMPVFTVFCFLFLDNKRFRQNLFARIEEKLLNSQRKASPFGILRASSNLKFEKYLQISKNWALFMYYVTSQIFFTFKHKSAYQRFLRDFPLLNFTDYKPCKSWVKFRNF